MSTEPGPALLVLSGLGAGAGAALGIWALRLVERIHEIDGRLTARALDHARDSGPRLWLVPAEHLDAS